MVYLPSIPSWPHLAQLRRRGQRPMGPVFLVPQRSYREYLWGEKGLYSLTPDGDPILLAGLRVVVMADKTPELLEFVQAVAAARPNGLQVEWEDARWQTVM